MRELVAAALLLAGCSLIAPFEDHAPRDSGVDGDSDADSDSDSDGDSGPDAEDDGDPDRDDDADLDSDGDAPPVHLHLGGTEIVATLVREVPASGEPVCRTASDPVAAAAGHWDLGGFGTCDGDGRPGCAGDARLLTNAAFLGPDDVVTYHHACVLIGQETSTTPVATIYLSWDPGTGDRVCLTPADPTAAAAGYWDLGGYAACDGEGLPRCEGGSRPVVMAATMTPDRHIKEHLLCVLTGQSTHAPVVATMWSEEDQSTEMRECRTFDDPAALAGRYFDYHQYGRCEDDEPTCHDGSRKVITGMTLLSTLGSAVRYHSACVLPGVQYRQNPVATILGGYDDERGNTCTTASDPGGAAAGLFDLGGYGQCRDDGVGGRVPACERPSQRITTAMTVLPDGSLEYHYQCVRTETVVGPSDAELFDGRTALVFAHQKDDLLWMLPFWQYSSRALLSAEPSCPSYEPVLARMPSYYQAIWEPIWGEVTDQVFVETYVEDPCGRDELITVDTVREQLRPYLDDPAVARVVTHAPWGEYGHVQHRLVSEAVRQLAVELGLDVWALAVRAHLEPDHPYDYVGPFGLETLGSVFERSLFDELRSAYQETDLGYPVGGETVDTWTWHDGELDYPCGSRTYVRIVEDGVDLVAGNGEIEALVAAVPPSGECE